MNHLLSLKLSPKWQFVILIVVFGFGCIVGRIFLAPVQSLAIQNLRDLNPHYRYIEPLLLCRILGLPTSPEFVGLQNKIKSRIDAANTDIHRVSVIFRDLKKGYGFGINEDDKYAPASLLKLPLMIAYLKAMESDPNLLNKKLVMDNDIDLTTQQNYPPKEFVKPGQVYTVQELINYMIMFSDNNAAVLLDSYLPAEARYQVYRDLGLSIPPEGMAVEFMSARLYSYFFRILFNATYLSADLSEQAMDLLTQAHFPDGIESAVPSQIPIAQKFGERYVKITGSKEESNASYNELHSCGIVFYPERPYLLCIMTEGKGFDNLSAMIKEISGLIYSEIHESSVSQK